MKKHRFSHIQIIALGYFIMILIGSALLCLPISSASGEWSNPLIALFTSTSASCVTGLVVENTATYWSIFGQIVILALIQIGGLGFMTIAMLFFRIIRRAGLRERVIMAESINTTRMNDLGQLIRKIVIGTAIIEGTGAVILAFPFVRDFGFLRGIYYAVFHSISAFCNAGFDIVSIDIPYASFMGYFDSITVNVVIMLLIIIGGIGFIVWEDFLKHKFHFKKYPLHSKLVLIITAFLVFFGAALFYVFERNNLCENMSVKDSILVSFFNSVTPRTAGFNTVDTAALTDSSKLLTMIFMFIGGSPGSTAGGIKTTTIAVMIIYIIVTNRGEDSPHAFGRKIGDDVIKKSIIILFINLSLALMGSLVICAMQNISLLDVLFECFSAIGTVGMSTGITRDLNILSRLVIIFLMYCGRVGSVSFAIALFEKRVKTHISYPLEQVNVG